MTDWIAGEIAEIVFEKLVVAAAGCAQIAAQPRIARLVVWLRRVFGQRKP